MSLSISIPRTAIAALVAASLLVALPGSAGAAVPRAGYYSGPTAQQAAVDFKVFKYGSFDGPVRKLLKVGATTQLTCASGEVKEDRFEAYIIMGGKIDRLGRFKYAYKGFTIRGRFTSRTSARGTLSRTVGDCKAESVSWTAKRTTAGIPIPS
jgi:hypothetical protein